MGVLLRRIPTAALDVLAGAWRGRLSDFRVVGITGTNGKTTTKDLSGGPPVAAPARCVPPRAI